ncbi:Xaa-Pro peptidase family protein [Peptoniphilus sp. MSJ-1]|uniref:Xaa-Pro peptidase family protein n=1 Tax=Peptoniphilus ovalis TaxID=2841503 RepID=A0ABS6FH04_9FIRM|nr:Xaa-Pro peptidase family protein [Peptoniphilus ovalis]MBU5669458.1 Xaa-Pro peptidase family protein [Peptoniphilus ovalis]
MNKRIENLVEKLKENKIDNLLITDPYAIFYFIGKWYEPGERLVLLNVSKDSQVILYVNKLFPTEDLGVELKWHDDTDNPLKDVIKDIKGTVGIDKKMPAMFLLPLIKETDCEFVEGSHLVDYLRGRKDSEEIEKMINASIANDKAMAKMEEKLSEGLTEEEMTKYLKSVYEDLGSKEFSFDPIIAYGANGANPHHTNDSSLPKDGDSIVVDMGCILDDYCSDMTRTFFYKSVPEESKKVYETVLAANLAGIAAVKPGNKLSDVDKAARKVIEDAGYGEYFTHRTGHFIGLETHDKGDVSSTNDAIIEVGNIFSVEPGIYLPGKVGVRIEDLVLVTEDGCKVLNNYNKEITIVG